MIESSHDYLALIECDDEESRRRLRFDEAHVSVWREIIELHPDLKRAVTLNKTLDAEIIRLLAADANPSVRSDIANKRSLPSDVFELLARDSEDSVRARIAWNKKTPLPILHELSDDESEIVNEPARKRLGC